MKYIFPIVAVVCGVAAATVGRPPSPPPAEASDLSRVGEVDPRLTGDELLARAAEELLEHVTIQARIRHQVSLFNRRISGTGQFHQAWSRDRVVSRLELKLPQGDQILNLRQVNDGDYLWTQRDVDKKSSLGRVDLRRVRGSAVADALPPAQQLALGGISQLLLGLRRHFEFESPRAAMLGEVPVWVLEGTWRASGGAGEGSSRPAGMSPVPDSVVLVLSRTESLPLFPFRVEYARHQAGDGGQLARIPIMAIDFFEVRVGGELDGRLFSYSAGDRELRDDTELFLAELGQ